MYLNLGCFNLNIENFISFYPVNTFIFIPRSWKFYHNYKYFNLHSVVGLILIKESHYLLRKIFVFIWRRRCGSPTLMQRETPESDSTRRRASWRTSWSSSNSGISSCWMRWRTSPSGSSRRCSSATPTRASNTPCSNTWGWGNRTTAAPTSPPPTPLSLTLAPPRGPGLCMTTDLTIWPWDR